MSLPFLVTFVPSQLSWFALHPPAITKPIVLRRIHSTPCSITSQSWDWIFDDGIHAVFFTHSPSDGFKHLSPKLWRYLTERATSIRRGGDWYLSKVAGSFQRRPRKNAHTSLGWSWENRTGKIPAASVGWQEQHPSSWIISSRVIVLSQTGASAGRLHKLHTYAFPHLPYLSSLSKVKISQKNQTDHPA